MIQSDVPDVSPSTLEVIPLGGLGEFGMNMMAVSWEDTTILIDAGVMFPEPDQLGVDLIIPDMTFVESRRNNVKALILTHGHEDHIGAVPHVMPLFDGPVYGTAMTLAFIQPKLDEHEIDAGDRLKTVSPRDTVTIGPFSIEFIRVTHSMPDCVALAITTPAGTIVHTGDFKIDQTPIDGQHFDLHRFAELGSQGVLALLLTAPTSIARASPGRKPTSSKPSRSCSPAHTASWSSPRSRRAFTGCRCLSISRRSSNARSPSSDAASSRTRRSPSASASCGFPLACRFATATCRAMRRRTCCASLPARRGSRKRRSRASRSMTTGS